MVAPGSHKWLPLQDLFQTKKVGNTPTSSLKSVDGTAIEPVPDVLVSTDRLLPNHFPAAGRLLKRTWLDDRLPDLAWANTTKKPPFGSGGFDFAILSRLSSSGADPDWRPNHFTPAAKDDRNKRNNDDDNNGKRFGHYGVDYNRFRSISHRVNSPNPALVQLCTMYNPFVGAASCRPVPHEAIRRGV